MKVLSLAIALCACHGSPSTLVPLGSALDAGRCDLRIACYDGVAPERCEPGVPGFEPTPQGCEIVQCFGEEFPLPDGGCISADCSWSDSTGVTCSPAVGCDLMPRSAECGGAGVSQIVDTSDPRGALLAKFWKGISPEPNTGCWIWTGDLAGQHGYGMVAFGRYHRTRSYTHRLSYEIHRGAIPAGMYVCHSCDNPLCCNPDHLFLGTPADNVHDCMRKGRLRPGPTIHDTRGEKNPASKISDSIVQNLRLERARNGTSYPKLAKMFGVSTSRAWQLCTKQDRA